MNNDFRLAGIKWAHQSLATERILNNRMLFSIQNCLLLFAELALILMCTVGDYYIFDSLSLINTLGGLFGVSERLARAFLDNSVHSLVGVVSWFIITYPKSNLYELALCGFLASIIDLDHFISAKSLNLIDAISLSSRPFLHNSLTLLVANCLLLAFVLYCAPERHSLCFLLFVAWFTHHVRDANRRGLWFGPVYTTKPLSDWVYLSIILILPLTMRHMLGYFKTSGYTRQPWFSIGSSDTEPDNLRRSIHVV
jgi:hypothetical protein